MHRSDALGWYQRWYWTYQMHQGEAKPDQSPAYLCLHLDFFILWLYKFAQIERLWIDVYTYSAEMKS